MKDIYSQQSPESVVGRELVWAFSSHHKHPIIS